MAFILDGTTGIATVDGSVSAPSQRGQDNNTGISYAADTIKFSTNGVERMSITNSGVIGAGGGKILQVVPNTQTFTSNTTTTSSSFTNLTSSLNTSITPSASSSKIFVIMTAPVYAANSYNGGIASFAIGRNGSTINGDDFSYGDIYVNTSGQSYMPLTMSILDTPNTDQPVTYNFMARTNSTSNAVGIGAYGRNEVVSITLFEVGA